MEIQNKSIERIKKIHREKGEEITDDKAKEEAELLRSFFNFIWEGYKKDKIKKNRLKKEPQGFPVDGYYNCLVCKNSINEKTGWYSKYGNTCLHC